MQISHVNNYNESAFRGSGFYSTTQELNSSVMLSRAVIDLFGCDIPWAVMANNSQERKERIRKAGSFYIVAWLSPFLTLPFTNRIAAKYAGKLTKNFWSNNHKVLHLSNSYLKNTDDMMQGLEKLADKTSRGPLEVLYNKIFPSKKYEQKLDIKALLDACGGDKEKLRKRIINSKIAVFASDFLLSFLAIGSFSFLNNELTKKETGQNGFSAEMSMANKEIVEKRAENYEKVKKKRFLTYLGIMCASTLALSAGVFGALRSKSQSGIVNFIRNNASKFDYVKGMYMSRLPLFVGTIIAATSTLLAARNNTERKDCAIRYSVGNAVFFGGDLLLGSLITNLSDRIFGTQLRQSANPKNLWQKVFPKIKPVSQVISEVEKGVIKSSNKKAAAGIFWANMLLIIASMGYLVPKLINKMIRADVQKDVDKNSQQLNKVTMEDFLDKINK